jgi:integrase
MRGLTVRAVETMRPKEIRREVPDRHLPGLYFIVQPSGAKSWAVRYRHGGRTRKYTLGNYPILDLKAAREAGAKALRAVAEGRDPGFEREQARAAVPRSIEATVQEFLEKHCARNNRARHARGTELLLRNHVLPRWRGRTIDGITKRDVLDVLDRIVSDGHGTTANRVLAAVRKLFNWAVARDILAASPCTGIERPAAERARDRVLTDAELRQIWQAAGVVGWPFAQAVKLLILTGQRRDEVARMPWSELNLEARLWTLPPERTKNKQRHEVPLSPQAVAVIDSVPRIASSQYVLSINGRGPANDYHGGMERLRALLPADMPRWTLHDLRRTLASGMARLGIDLHVVEKVLNHTSGTFSGVLAVYQRHDFADKKRAALEAWGAFVERLTSSGC